MIKTFCPFRSDKEGTWPHCIKEECQNFAILYLKKSTECYAQGDFESGEMFRKNAFEARKEFALFKAEHEKKYHYKKEETSNGAIRINKPV
jgi:hypothetical protein